MADISKIKPNGTTYNLKDAVARNMESLDSTERVVGVGHDGVSTLYKKTVKYIKPANSVASVTVQPSDIGLTDLTKIECIKCVFNEYYNNSVTPTGYCIPAPVDFVTNTNAWLAFYIPHNNTLNLRLGPQYAESKLDMYFTIWYTK